jgi:transcriptional regulator with XRE-family HTH domain
MGSRQMVYITREMATQPNHHLAALVGTNIAAARERAGLTQQEVATAVKTSISRVSDWERGLHMPSRSVQPLLAELLFEGDVTAMFRQPDEVAA